MVKGRVLGTRFRPGNGRMPILPTALREGKILTTLLWPKRALLERRPSRFCRWHTTVGAAWFRWGPQYKDQPNTRRGGMPLFGGARRVFLGVPAGTFWRCPSALFGDPRRYFLGVPIWTFGGSTFGLFWGAHWYFFEAHVGIFLGRVDAKSRCYGDPPRDFLGVHIWTFLGCTFGLFGGPLLDFFGVHFWTFWWSTFGLFGAPLWDFWVVHFWTFAWCMLALLGTCPRQIPGSTFQRPIWESCRFEVGELARPRFEPRHPATPGSLAVGGSAHYF